jgi:hypothetical protein
MPMLRRRGFVLSWPHTYLVYKLLVPIGEASFPATFVKGQGLVILYLVWMFFPLKKPLTGRDSGSAITPHSHCPDSQLPGMESLIMKRATRETVTRHGLFSTIHTDLLWNNLKTMTLGNDNMRVPC